MDKQGQFNQIMIVLIMAGILAAIIVFFYVYTLVQPVITKTTGEVNTIVNGIAGTDNADNANITAAVNVATSPVEGINNVLSWFGYFMFFGMLIAFLIIAFNVRASPYLGFFWIGIIACLALLSMWLSNSYEEIKVGDAYIRAAYEANGVSDFLMSYLPHLVVAFGLIGGLLLFLLISINNDAEAFQ